MYSEEALSELDGYKRIVEKKGIADYRSDIFDGADLNSEGNTFNRYNWIYPSEELSSLLSYVFIVRPDLNIIKPVGSSVIELTPTCQKDPYFVSLSQSNPELLRNTCAAFGGYTHDFVNFLLDRVESYQISDWGVSTQDVTQPFTNFKVQYAGNANDSLSAREFSITFREDSDLRVTKFFTAWVRYMNGVVMNRFETRQEYQHSRFKNGAPVLDYATSIYLLKTKPDGSEIVYFHKMTGAFPTTIPHSNWSYNRGGDKEEPKIDILFSGGFPEPLNPQVLGEFNYNSRIGTLSQYRGSFAPPTEIANWGQPIVGRPYILRDVNRGIYRLFWESAY